MAINPDFGDCKNLVSLFCLVALVAQVSKCLMFFILQYFWSTEEVT